ncbi:hypothetical protein [Nocardia anaemiae]|uniref:hypothetical protein n=1 Tax=Nocardia anaemiae TaxID=263910 RepID=UPI000AAF3A64|nr:hypothetical protein [Nocardia anaemiae]
MTIQPTAVPTIGTRSPSVPRRDIKLSLATGRPIPREWLPDVLALVDEQERIGGTREPDTLSQMEAVAMSKGMLAAEEIRECGAEQLGQLVDEAASIKGEITIVRAELDRLDEQPVAGMNGDVIPASEANKRMKAVSTTVTEERDAGNVNHRRVPAWLSRYSTWIAVVDFPVLLYFVTQVFNVDLAGLASGAGSAWGESLVPLLTSVVFALLGTAAVAVGLKFFGQDLKGYKNDTGHIQLPEGKARTLPLLFIGLAAAMAISAGIVMAYRIVTDSLAAGGSIVSATVLGVFFAIIVATVNMVVFAAYFRDGSPQTDEIRHLTAQLKPIERRRMELHRQIDALTAQLPLLRLKAERVYAATLAAMGTPIKGADQLRLIARSYHQGCGAQAQITSQHGRPSINLTAPHVDVDRSILVELMDRLDELVAGDGTATEGKTPTAAPKNAVLVPVAPTEADDASDDLDGEW